MKRYLVWAAVSCALACKQEPHAAPSSPFAERRSGSGPVALFNNGGFESGDLGGWTVESFLNNGVTYPTVNGTTVPPQTVADLGLATGGVANSSATGPASGLSQLPNGLSASTTLRWPIYGSYSAVVNGQHDVAQLNGTYPYGANKNVNSIKQDMLVATTDVDPTDGLAHVRFVVAPVLQNPNHTTTEQPYYFLHVKNLTTGQELFNRFNYVSQAGVPWQTDAGGTIEYLAWQAVDVAAPGLINVGDDVQAQVIAAGCSLGGHWGEAYVDAFGAFLPGLSINAHAPQLANAGSNLTTTYAVNNSGVTSTTNTTVVLPMPSQTTFVSLTPPPGAICTLPGVGTSGNVTCNLGTMNPSSALSLTLVSAIAAGASGTITNGSYTVTSTGNSVLLGPLVTTSVTNAVSYADLAVSIDDGNGAVAWSQNLSYTIVVSNNGPLTATNAAVTDTIPAQLTTATWTCVAAGGGTCGAASGSGNINTTVTLPAGASATYTLSAKVVSGSGTSRVTDVVNVTAGAGYSDPDTTSNRAADTDDIGNVVTVTVQKDAAGTGQGSIVSGP